jgi:uncharacterized protein (TIGR00156 family)
VSAQALRRHGGRDPHLANGARGFLALFGEHEPRQRPEFHGRAAKIHFSKPGYHLASFNMPGGKMMSRSIALATLLAVAPFASAQYFGPGAQGSATKVKAVLDHPVDDQYVVLRGTLTSQVGSEKYMFSDGSEQIRVEIDDDVFPRHRIGPETTVELYGEVEKDFMQSVEIDVDRMLTVDGQAAPVESATTTP